MEKTLVLIKPDGLKHTIEIMNIFHCNNLKVEDYKIMKLTDDIVDEHYSHLLDKDFYPELKRYMTSDVVVALILSGNNVVERTRKVVGATNPEKAEKGTIRNLYGTNITYNAVHASDSDLSAEIEINRFFKNNTKTR